MTYADDEWVMISALQHYLFCRRQCALIHLEAVWKENYLTASGRRLHERVDRMGGETRKNVHLATALKLSSARYGIYGVADMVEFHGQDVRTQSQGKGAKIPGRDGLWVPFPIEYKRGKPKEHRADEVQLCAQALCLEEMLDVEIESGALFYGANRRRTDVQFDRTLRQLTIEVINGARSLLLSGITPPPVRTKGCEACSLKDMCFEGVASARDWIRSQTDKVILEGMR